MEKRKKKGKNNQKQSSETNLNGKSEKEIAKTSFHY